MAVEKKDAKPDGQGGPRPNTKTIVGVASLPQHGRADLELEELSGSLLVEELPTPAGAPAPPQAPATMPPAAEAEAEEVFADDIEITTLPQDKLEPLVAALKQSVPVGETEPAPGTPSEAAGRWPLPLVAVCGLAVGVGLVVAVVLAARHGSGAPHGSDTPGIASQGRSSAAPPPSAAAASSHDTAVAAAPIGSTAPGALAPCAVAGSPRVLAPSATLTAGVEARAFGDDVAVGFAANDGQAMLVRLDPASMAVSESSVSRSVDPIRRATPIPGKGGRLDLAVDVDRASDPLRERRTLPLDPPLQLGTSAAHLAWAPFGGKVRGALWPLEGQGHVEALRGARSETDLSSVAVAFRRDSAIWTGTADVKDGLVPRGGLWRIDGTGSQVGSPAVAYSDGVVFVAWADRSSGDEPWRLRWVRFKAGERPGEPRTFAPPPGGRGQQAMSPGLAVVAGGRFLLVWTEGATAAHEVRALTLSSEGQELGEPLRISGDDSNAGQGQAAIANAGRGIVAFLESAGAGFQVGATPIACGH